MEHSGFKVPSNWRVLDWVAWAFFWAQGHLVFWTWSRATYIPGLLVLGHIVCPWSIAYYPWTWSCLVPSHSRVLSEDRGGIHIWYLHFPTLGVFLVARRVYPRTSGAFRIENWTSVTFATESSRESANMVYMETCRVLFISLGAFSSRCPSQMAQLDCQEALNQKHANSYHNLKNTHKAAVKKKNYDTHKTWVALADIFTTGSLM